MFLAKFQLKPEEARVLRGTRDGVLHPVSVLYDLRIDNSGRRVNYTIDHNLETMLVTITCDIPNKKWYFCLSYHISVIVNTFDLITL